MESITALTTIFIALSLGAISPGPSFVYVARCSAEMGHSIGLRTAFGMGLGGMLFAILSAAGVGTLMAQAPDLFFILRLAGAAYLAFLAVSLWRDAKSSPDFDSMANQKSKGDGIWKGFVVQISNPKTVIVYSSVFAVALPQGADIFIATIVTALVFCIEFGWYAIVATAFSTSASRKAYLRAKTSLDRLAALVMGGLAGKVAWDAFR